MIAEFGRTCKNTLRLQLDSLFNSFLATLTIRSGHIPVIFAMVGAKCFLPDQSEDGGGTQL